MNLDERKDPEWQYGDTECGGVEWYCSTPHGEASAQPAGFDYNDETDEDTPIGPWTPHITGFELQHWGEIEPAYLWYGDDYEDLEEAKRIALEAFLDSLKDTVRRVEDLLQSMSNEAATT